MIHQEPSSPPTRTSQLLLAAILAGGLFAASPTPPPSGASGTSPTEVAAMVAKAERLMAEGTWPQAARAWSKVETADPGLAEAAYNRGVAEYRSGELAAAADAFRRAAEVGDADLAAQAMYNEGTARYADAVKRLSTEGGESAPSPSGDPETPTDPLEDAMERVGRSLDHFRDAIDADPGNLDARANAELAHRLLQRLQEIQESSQDDQSQPGEESQDDQQQPGEESQDDQQQPGEQSQDDQQQPGEQSQDDQQQPGEQSQDDQQQGGSAQDQPTEGGEAAEGSAAEDDKMSREEAERLLQSVRDKERQRRRARAEAESEIQDRRPPARKDW